MQGDYSETVRGVELIRWNPVRASGGRVDNFGDLLGPLVVRRLVDGLPDGRSGRTLLTIGSILQFADRGSVVWGSGINAKLRPRRLDPSRMLDVRAVRGPLTAAALGAEGVGVPDVQGDPGLLLPVVFPETREFAAPEQQRHAVVVVPNVNDRELDAAGHPVVSPVGAPFDVIREVLAAGLVVGTSLHAIVTAEAYGIPARAVRSASESIVKYVDYYEGTGRRDVAIADSVEHAVELGGAPPVRTDGRSSLLDAFPADLWDPAVAIPGPVEPPPLGTIVQQVTARAVAGDAGWQALARRLVVPVLRYRGTLLDDEQLDVVMAAVRLLDDHGVLDAHERHTDRTRLIADLRLGDLARRAAVLGTRGRDAVLDSVERAGEDGLLRLGGTLHLPEGRLRDHEVRLVTTGGDASSDPLPVDDVVLDETEPLLGTVRWSAAVPVRSLRPGATALVFSIDGAAEGGVVVRSAPPMSFHRWWLGDLGYRVDRTARGNVVIHSGTEHR